MRSCSTGGGMRKGAWTEEEDILLKNCIDKYGEGKWHQVPNRAGLNRCRKSCRLRWMNYLRPDIKRGDFTLDEVDLIIRLHNLLGNRWSLIAGRLPGRTANDVKNYWNTHLHKDKKHPPEAGPNAAPMNINNLEERTLKAPNSTTATSSFTIFKPRPRTFSKDAPWSWLRATPTSHTTIMGDHNSNINNASSISVPFADDEIDQFEGRDALSLCGSGEELLWSRTEEELSTKSGIKEAATGNVDTRLHEGQSGKIDICIDADLWDFLLFDQ